MYCLSIYKGNTLIKSHKVIVSQKVISIGRHHLNDIPLPDPSCKISRFHAALFRDAEGNYFLQDLGSRNNTYINEKKRNYGILTPGDRIGIGDYCIAFQKQSNKTKINKSNLTLIDEGNDDIKTTFSPITFQWEEIMPLKDDPEGLLLLYQLNHLANFSLDIEESLQLIIKQIFKVFHPDRILIALIEQSGENLTCLARIPEESEMKISRTMIQYCLDKKQVLVTNNALTDKRFKKQGRLARSILGLQLKSAISVPFQWDGDIKGILYLDSLKQKWTFTERDLNLLTLIGKNISTFMERYFGYKAVKDEKVRLKNRLEMENTIIGISPKMKDVLKKIKKYADIDSTILLTGETGTGKDLIAETIHKNSLRNEKPFIHANCAAIPENLLESEFFGVIANYPGFGNNPLLKGKFELANGGTIFLNEIGELPLKLQAKLLDILEHKKISPLGADQPISVDIRIIAATNRNLYHEVCEGRFREDLYERLNILPFHLPPLRERQEDIPLLAGYFLHKIRQKLGKTISGFSNSSIKHLSSYKWPRNIRELKNTIERAIIQADRPIITSEVFDIKNEKIIKPKSLKDAEKEHIWKVLDFVRGNKEKACRILGISRQTLYNKGREYNFPGFEVDQTV